MSRFLAIFLAAWLLTGCATGSIYPDDAEYSYFLSLPETDQPGPYPTVLFMPACPGGLVAREVLEQNHARHLRELGFATVMFDPVTRRGIKDGQSEICRDRAIAWHHYYLRVDDIKHFVENVMPNIEEIDAERVGLFGQSGGGISAFRFANANIREKADLPDAFAALIAEQSACHFHQVGTARFWDKPFLLIAPEADSLNPYEACIKIANDSDMVEVVVLEGAAHAYDWPYPMRYVYQGGKNVKMWPSERGKTKAREASLEFFSRHLLD